MPPSLVTDNGCQPTSVRFVAECDLLGLEQIFTSYNNPKGNADTERVLRTLKEDLVWPRDFSHFHELAADLDDWVHAYNHEYPHSALGYQTPYQYEAWYAAAARIA
jgi:transposase InsO family protein